MKRQMHVQVDMVNHSRLTSGYHLFGIPIALIQFSECTGVFPATKLILSDRNSAFTNV